MSQNDGLINLLIHNKHGKPQIIKVQKGSKVFLPSGTSKVITNQAIKGVYSSALDTKLMINDKLQQGVTTVVKVQTNKASSTAEMKTGSNAASSNSELRPVCPEVSGGSSVVSVPSESVTVDEVADSTEIKEEVIDSESSEMSEVKSDADGLGEYDTTSTTTQEQGVTRKKEPRRKRNSGGIKKKRVDKSGKGLRHFSMKVCEKVRRKGMTTYNEVADELVEEFTNPANLTYVGEQYDQKNIRRRVYDALNVLMAMNIISKEKKEINWIGLPTNSLQECINLVNEKKNRMAQVKEKLNRLKQLIMQQVCFKQLVERNKMLEMTNGPPDEGSKLQLPFILINTHRDTGITCSIARDKSEYFLEFDDSFNITDDVDVLRHMDLVLGLDKGECSGRDLKLAKKMVPKVLQKYVVKLAKGKLEQEPTIHDLMKDERIFKKASKLQASVNSSDPFIEHVQIQPSRSKKRSLESDDDQK